MGVRDYVNDNITDAAVTSVATKYGMGGGSLTSIIGFVTSNGLAVLIGILVTVGGFVVNYWFQRRRETREIEGLKFDRAIALAEEQRRIEMHAAQMQALRDHNTIK